jgi:soluble lytic murein transglycosylase
MLLPGGIPNTANDIPVNATQIPIALRQWAQVENLETPAALKFFKQGVDAYLDKRYDSALEFMPGEQEAKATSVADYILVYRAKINLMMGHDREALEGFRLLEKQYPSSPLLQDALLGQCQALLKMQDAPSALSVLNNPRLRKNSDALYYQARAFELAGQKAKAMELYLQLYAGYPKAEFAALAERTLLALSPAALKGKGSYKVRLQRAEGLLKANDTRGSRQLLLALGPLAAPDSSSSQKRSLLLADADYRLGRTAMALSLLRKVTAADPAMHAKALRLEGLCYRKSEKEQALLAQRAKALRLYPQSPDTEELCYSAATYFPKGRYAERSAWKLALFHYFEKEYGEAALGFWRYLQAYPNPASAAAAMYWMGRCYEMLGGSENARYLYRRVQALANDSYFGQRARASEASLVKSGNTESTPVSTVVFEQVIAACDAIRLQAAFLPEPGSAVIPSIERARQLWSAGLPDMAISELRWTSQRFPQDDKPLSYIMARIYASNDDYQRGIACLRGIFPDYASMRIAALPDEAWQLLFPVRHWDIVSAEATKNQLHPSLILGLIRQESAFNEKARSSADARGLMQLLPATASKLARQAQIPRYNAEKLFQAETNIVLGTRYLDFLMQRYGKTELALAAYNAGSTRVDRWLKEFGDVDMPEFVEKIPFSETRGYIKQVLSNQAFYGLLTSSAAPGTR